VEGLLSFGEETRFELGQLNILVGPNGSGKSNLLDCIRVFRNASLDIQETFKDSGFESWLHRGINQKTGSASLEVTVNVPELPIAIRHQVRFGPPQSSRAPLEETISSGKAEDEGLFFAGSHRSGAILSSPEFQKR